MYPLSAILKQQFGQALAGEEPGTRIPPELFDLILFYVASQCVHDDLMCRTMRMSRERGGSAPGDVLMDLKRCSLVCRFWAHECRRYIFGHTTLIVRCHEDAQILRTYALHGYSSLTPIHDLVHRIFAYQDYNDRSSFSHLLYLPCFRTTFKALDISGPIPKAFHPTKLDTPYWGLPPSAVPIRSCLENFTIWIEDIHLPSFVHVTKYARHFAYAECLQFARLTWDGGLPNSLPRVSQAIARGRRPCEMQVSAHRCTDNFNLALTAVMLNPRCPLHLLGDVEYTWMISLVMILWDSSRHDTRDVKIGEHQHTTRSPKFEIIRLLYLGFQVSKDVTRMWLGDFSFIFSPSTTNDVTGLSVISIHAYIGTYKLCVDLGSLVAHLRSRFTLHDVTLCFDCFECLQEVVQPYQPFAGNSPGADNFRLTLAYRKTKDSDENDHRAVCVDPVTLEPNGTLP